MSNRRKKLSPTTWLARFSGRITTSAGLPASTSTSGSWLSSIAAKVCSNSSGWSWLRVTVVSTPAQRDSSFCMGAIEATAMAKPIPSSPQSRSRDR